MRVDEIYVGEFFKVNNQMKYSDKSPDISQLKNQVNDMIHFIPPSQRRVAMLAAQVDSAPVLIYGGSGSGKGAIARWIHANSPRMIRELIMADKNKKLADQLKNAHSSTLVVSEISEYPLSEQMVLLQYLKNKSIQVSEHTNTPMIVNVRVIATTSHSLEGRAQSGLFNAELLEKLNVFRIDMPALMKRMDEFDDITNGLLGEITRELHKEYLKSISPDAWAKLKSYDWPGNLRELRNVMRIAILTSQSDTIQASDLPSFGHDRADFRATRDQFEKLYILELLNTFNWKIDETCQVAQLDKNIFLAKIKKYGIDVSNHLVS